MHAFISYQTAGKQTAALVAELLAKFECTSFMAHENIEVSQEWRIEILKQIEAADIFVPILSAAYYQSIWCKQESGIAAFRQMTIIPLSIDGSIPQGFIAHIQSTKIDPAAPTLTNLLPGVAKHDVAFVLDMLIERMRKSGSFRSAEADFEMILPFLGKASKEQNVRLLSVSNANKQVCHATLCASKYLPPILAAYGQFMKTEDREELAETIKGYTS